MTCKARQYSDQMQCGACGLAWDVNDPDPPPCKTEIERWREQDRKRRHVRNARKGAAVFKQLLRGLNR